MKQPPCSEWAIWKGAEVEGVAGKGSATLFIRSLASYPNLKATDDLAFFRTKSKCSRVWFCKEFTNWAMIRAIMRHFDETCIEVEPKCLDSIPKSIRAKARIYLKVPSELKAGDYVCVGPAFQDEAFEIGTGAKVTPEDYLNDKKIA